MSKIEAASPEEDDDLDLISFKVLLQELRSIGLDISTYQLEKFSSNKTYEIEVNLMENYDVRSKTFSPTLNINNILF